MFTQEIRKVLAIGVILHVTMLVGCQGTGGLLSTEEVISAEKPSGVLKVVEGAIMEVGEGLISDGQAQAAQGVLGKVRSFSSAADQLCNEHAMPLDDQGGILDSQQGDYPSRLFYCKLAKNTGSPDSIPGTFRQLKSMSCAIEKAGIVFDNQERQVFVTLDHSCFSQQQLSDMGVTSMWVGVRASRPAFFNTYYDAGISLTVPNHGTHNIATKVVGTKLEFMTYEDQTSISPDKTGAYAVSFDLLTGQLKFESRSDRFLCPEYSSCGWSRHDRLVAQVAMVNGEITAVSQIEGIASEIYGDGNNYSARTSTIKGNLDSGLKARYFMVNSNTSADLGDATKYTEVVNNRCYTHDSNQGNCGANTGIALPQQVSFKFSLHPSTQSTSPTAWVDQLVGLTFNSVNFDDVQ